MASPAVQRQPCLVLRVADCLYVSGRALGSSRHRSECWEVTLLRNGRPSEQRYALKVNHEDTAETREAFVNERRALELCRSCHFVVSLHRACERQLVLVQELAAFDLSKISLYNRLPLSWARWVAASMVLALECLHCHRVLHLDVKIDNVLVSFDGFPMLADLGCAAHLDALDDRVALETFRGTMTYAAPELLEERCDGSWRHVASRASDLWSLGILCYRLTFGQFPESHDPEATSTSTDQVRAPVVSDGQHGALQCMHQMRISAQAARKPLVRPSVAEMAPMCPAWEFVASLLQQDPLQRNGAARKTKPHSWRSNLYDDLRSHSFFDGLDWDALAAKRLSPLDLSPPFCAVELNQHLTV